MIHGWSITPCSDSRVACATIGRSDVQEEEEDEEKGEKKSNIIDSRTVRARSLRRGQCCSKSREAGGNEPGHVEAKD